MTLANDNKSSCVDMNSISFFLHTWHTSDIIKEKQKQKYHSIMMNITIYDTDSIFNKLSKHHIRDICLCGNGTWYYNICQSKSRTSGVTPVFLVGYVLLLVLVLLVYAVFRFCLCLLGEGVFVFVLCLLCPLFPVSLYCPFVIFSSGFSNVYLLCINVNRPPTYPLR